MSFTTTYQDAGSMGDRKYAYGTWAQSGAAAGHIDVPMQRVDFLFIQDTGATCYSGATKPYGVTFPYSSGAGTRHEYHTQVPVHACASGISGLWWAFGKRG